MPPIPLPRRIPKPFRKSTANPLKPFWATTDGTTARLYFGHVADVLARLPARSVQTVARSVGAARFGRKGSMRGGARRAERLGDESSKSGS